MLKRFLFAGLFAVIVIGLAGLIFINSFDKVSTLEVRSAIPSDAVLFIEDLDYIYLSENYFSTNRSWIDFIQISGKVHLDSLLKVGMARISSSDVLHKHLGDEGLNLSLHVLGKDRLTPLFLIKYAGSFNEDEFRNLLTGILGEEALVNQRKYETEILLDVSGAPGGISGTFTMSFLKGICLLSPSSLLVEEAIRTIHSNEGSHDPPGLEKVRATAGKYVHANIYINYSQLPGLFHPFLKEKAWKQVEALAHLASWGELDMNLKENSFTFSGMTWPESEESLFLNSFGEQAPVKMELHELLPSGVSSFLHLGFSDKEKLLSAYKEQLPKDMLGKVWEEKQQIEYKYGIDPLSDLEKIAEDELVWFSMEGKHGGSPEEIMILETHSASETREIVLNWIEQYLLDQPFDMESMREVYRLDKETAYNIYRLPDHFYQGLAPGRLFNVYFTLYENYLLFGPSVELLSKVIYQNTLGKTIVKDALFKEISPYLSNRSNLTFFFQPQAFFTENNAVLKKNVALDIEKMELFLRRVPGVVTQFSKEGELFYHSLSLNYTSQIKEKALTVWESLMDTSIIIKPALVVNHSTSEKEIFVQDASGKIYLVNSAGRVLWKQAVEGPIMGKVHQVDFYKNGKLQYLFNTANKIHLLDRNGNYVERYPITLRSEASAPLSLFDYDKNKNYRLFLPTEDRKIYVYDLEGNIITGWKFGKTETPIRGTIQHFRIGDMDYIMFSDQNRAYVVDRRGRDRIKIKEQMSIAPQNPWILDMNIREEKPRWITTDTRGNVKALYLDGSVITLFARELTPEHFFCMEDLNCDGIVELIVADGNHLEVNRLDGSKIFDYKVREHISHMPDMYKFSASDVKIGITDGPRNRIYMLNADGSLYEGFPLEGSTRFSIGYFAGSESRFNLIVGSENSFLYNYSIQ